MQSVREGTKPFKCNICDYENVQKRNLKRHIESVHEGNKPFKCIISGYKTALKGHLKKHMESVLWRNEAIPMQHLRL